MPSRDYGCPVRIVLTQRKCMVYKAACTDSYEPIWLTVGTPGLQVWSIPAREVRRYSPVIPKRILDEEAIHLSLRYRNDLSIATGLE